MNHRTAILLFSRSASLEAVEKDFAGDRSINERIAAALIGRAKRTIGRAGLPVFQFDERTQRGNTFGERLSGAVSDIFARGFEHLIVVGNDAPRLRVAHLARAIQTLESGRCTLGLDRRGGAWLIGLRRTDFDHDVFAGLPWQTTDLASKLQQLLGGAQLLPVLFDINALGELRAQWHHFRSLLAGLADLIDAVIDRYSAGTLLRVRQQSSASHGRAPPVAA